MYLVCLVGGRVVRFSLTKLGPSPFVFSFGRIFDVTIAGNQHS